MESLTITVDILSAWLMGDLGKLGKLESYVLRKVLRMPDCKGTAQYERGVWIAHLTSGLAMIYTGLESVSCCGRARSPRDRERFRQKR